ncbi:MAG TPA: transcriptional regulator [Acidobacteriaceae bacterium]
MTRPDNQQWEFGPFRLDGAQYLLFRDGKVVPLSRKATDVLLVLLEHHGQLVEKEVLMRRVWPDSFVEESNLAVHISQLRKILSEDAGPCRIETIPRRGYRFIGELNREAAPEAAPIILPQTPPAAAPTRWPLSPAIAAVALFAIAFLALYLHHRAIVAARRATDLRAQTIQRERFAKEAHQYQFVTGDLIRAAPIYENWAAAFPGDIVPRTNLALIDSDLGKFGPSLDHGRAALRMAPGDSRNYDSLASHYIASDSLNEARAVIDRAVARNLDSPGLHLDLYDIAFLQRDDAGMARQMAWAAGNPALEGPFLEHYANTLAFVGKDAQAAAFTGRAADAARRANAKETAAGCKLDAAQHEALFGNPADAKRLAGDALALAHDRDTIYGAALVLALAGAVAPANAIVDQLNHDFPDDTFVQYLYLPTIRAAVALQQKDPVRAERALEVSIPYELGVAGGLVPVYVRGLAFLASNDSPRAEAEFQKVIANPGVVLNSPIGPLSRLQLARAYALEGDRTHAKAAYQDFLTRWKDADPNLPILRAAKAEYAKQ